jgi:hypothetical protein
MHNSYLYGAMGLFVVDMLYSLQRQLYLAETATDVEYLRH